MPPLTPARRAFLSESAIHPVLLTTSGIWMSGDIALAHASGVSLMHAGLIERIAQGDYTAEEWDGTRLLGYRYRLTPAGRAAVATTEE